MFKFLRKNHVIFLFFIGHLLSGTALSQDLCSPEAKIILKEMNANLHSLEKHCTKKSAAEPIKKMYDLSTETADFAELTDDLSSSKGIGSQIKLNLKSYAFSDVYCSTSISKFQDKPLLICEAKPDKTIYIYSGNRETRLNLTKKRTSEPQPLLVVGTIIGYNVHPIIELK